MQDYGLEQEKSELRIEEDINKKKIIVILDGMSKGKTQFLNFAKDSGIWVWSISSTNVLTAISHKLYWDSNRNRKFYDFLTEFSELSNRYFNFEENYIKTMLEKFERNNRVDMLVIHNCSKPLRDKLYNVYKDNCRGIKIVDEDTTDINYHYILNYNNNYDDEIKKLLEELLKKEDTV